MKTRTCRSARMLAVVLALILTLLLCTACASKGKTLLTLNKDGTRVTFSVNAYELMLSRMKGMLTQAGYAADEESFWSILDKHNGTDMQTLSEYYGDLILENCMTFTAVLWYFEKNDLSLTDAQIQTVDDRLQSLLDEYADGSKTKLNAILSEFGVNYQMLRDVYLLEEKVNAVQNHLYGVNGSKLGVTVKNEFLKNNYIRFKQIHLPSFNYVYETDKNNDVIYYVNDSFSSAIAYDTVNGYPATDANGIPVTDADGNEVYYTQREYAEGETKRIAYDKINGIPSYVLDDKGYAKTTEKTPEELEALEEYAKKLFDELQGCTVEEFEARMEQENRPVLGGTVYEEGYYIQKNVDYTAASADSTVDFSYLSDIVTSLDAMDTRGIASISASTGYYIVMKYEPLENAYDREENEVWFSNFTESLLEYLLLEDCRALFPDITVDEKVLATAREIKNIGANPVF